MFCGVRTYQNKLHVTPIVINLLTIVLIAREVLSHIWLCFDMFTPCGFVLICSHHGELCSVGSDFLSTTNLQDYGCSDLNCDINSTL